MMSRDDVGSHCAKRNGQVVEILGRAPGGCQLLHSGKQPLAAQNALGQHRFAILQSQAKIQQYAAVFPLAAE